MATFTDIQIINQALTGLGNARISSLTEGTTAALVLAEHYEAVKAFTLTRSNWHFATAKASLNKLSGAPTNRWSTAWQLPGDCLKVLTTWPPSNYEIFGSRLYTNESTVQHLDYIRNVPEADWPAWFVRLVVANLITRCCRGITGDAPAQDMVDEARDADIAALTQDSQQQPNQTMLPNAFIDSRY